MCVRTLPDKGKKRPAPHVRLGGPRVIQTGFLLLAIGKSLLLWGKNGADREKIILLKTLKPGFRPVKIHFPGFLLCPSPNGLDRTFSSYPGASRLNQSRSFQSAWKFDFEVLNADEASLSPPPPFFVCRIDLSLPHLLNQSFDHMHSHTRTNAYTPTLSHSHTHTHSHSLTMRRLWGWRTS